MASCRDVRLNKAAEFRGGHFRTPSQHISAGDNKVCAHGKYSCTFCVPQDNNNKHIAHQRSCRKYFGHAMGHRAWWTLQKNPRHPVWLPCKIWLLFLILGGHRLCRSQNWGTLRRLRTVRWEVWLTTYRNTRLSCTRVTCYDKPYGCRYGSKII